MKNLVYFCLFFNKVYLEFLDILLSSIKNFGNLNDNIDLMIITTPTFKNNIENIIDKNNIDCKIFYKSFETKFEGSCSRLEIFNYTKINEYNKILYIDLDILISNDLNNLFKLHLENKLYALKEGSTNHYFWGGLLFRKYNKKKFLGKSAFSSGVLLFNNCKEIKDLFSKIKDNINSTLLSINSPILGELKEQPDTVKMHGTKLNDQPFFVFNAISNNLFDNTLLEKKVIIIHVSNEVIIDSDKFTNEIVVIHFAGSGVDFFEVKKQTIKNFYNKLYDKWI